MTQSQFTPGDRVTWSYVPRGGYGYVVPVDGTVTSVTAKRVKIQVRRHNGDETVVCVRPENLKLKEME